MDCASKEAYVSKNFMAEYSRKKNKKKQESEKMVDIQDTSKDSKSTSFFAKISGGASAEKRRRSRSRSLSNEEEEVNGRERCRSIEYVHSDDLENDLNHSDEENFAEKEKMQKKVRSKKAPARVFQQEVDVNVFKIRMETLKDAGELATGDPVFCKSCLAAFSLYSQIEEKEMIGATEQIWNCEFCNT